MALCVTVLFAVSTVTYVWIERAGIELGKRLVRGPPVVVAVEMVPARGIEPRTY